MGGPRHSQYFSQITFAPVPSPFLNFTPLLPISVTAFLSWFCITSHFWASSDFWRGYWGLWITCGLICKKHINSFEEVWASWVQAIRSFSPLPLPAPWFVGCSYVVQNFREFGLFVGINRQASKPYWNKWILAMSSLGFFEMAARSCCLTLHCSSRPGKPLLADVISAHPHFSQTLTTLFSAPLICLPWRWNPHWLPVTFLIDF